MRPGKKILFLANWPKTTRNTEQGYAFFRHFQNVPEITFLGSLRIPLISRIEKQLLRFYIIQSLIAFFRASSYDLVLAYSSQCGLPLAMLFRLFGKRAPLILFDVETFGRPERGLKKKLVAFALPAVDHVVYASSRQREFYDAHFPGLIDKCTHIPIGIGAYEKQISFSETIGSDHIIAIGRHDRRFRDWTTLLRAFAKVNDRISLLIVGRETIEPENRSHLPIPDGVRFVPYVPIEKLQELAERARFAVLPLPERNQSLGQLSILFLMAMGKAVIVSKVMGVEDYLEPESSGLFYRTGDADDLAAQITRLLDEPEKTVEMGRAGRQLYETRFNDRIMGQRWEAVIEKVLF